MAYQFEDSWQHERERLAAIEGRLSADDAARLLDAIRSPSFRATTAIHFAVWGRRASA